MSVIHGLQPSSVYLLRTYLFDFNTGSAMLCLVQSRDPEGFSLRNLLFNIFIYLKCRVREREKRGKTRRDRLSVDSLPKWPKAGDRNWSSKWVGRIPSTWASLIA